MTYCRNLIRICAKNYFRDYPYKAYSSKCSTLIPFRKSPPRIIPVISRKISTRSFQRFLCKFHLRLLRGTSLRILKEFFQKFFPKSFRDSHRSLSRDCSRGFSSIISTAIPAEFSSGISQRIASEKSLHNFL